MISFNDYILEKLHLDKKTKYDKLNSYNVGDYVLELDADIDNEAWYETFFQLHLYICKITKIEVSEQKFKNKPVVEIHYDYYNVITSKKIGKESKNDFCKAYLNSNGFLQNTNEDLLSIFLPADDGKKLLKDLLETEDWEDLDFHINYFDNMIEDYDSVGTARDDLYSYDDKQLKNSSLQLHQNIFLLHHH